MDPDNLPKFVYLHKNHKYRLKLGFYAAPSNPKTFSKAIRSELHKLKFTYCPDLNGLIMGFGKISSNELIQADIRHCINVAINVDVYIFRPPVGSIIEAVVNQISDNHVSCLVHNLFNVSIVRPEHQPYIQWSGSKIKKDDKINVKVLSFDLTKKLPHITGDIVDTESDEHFSSKDKQDDFSSSSSSEEFTSDLIKSIKQVNKMPSANSSKSPSSNSESSDETNTMVINSKKLDKKSTKISPISTRTTTDYNKHKEEPLCSSTPLSYSEHTIGSINLIRTKQLEQLHKHLAKNSTEKQKSLEDPIKSLNKGRCSQSSNISKDDNSDVEINVPSTSINKNYSLYGDNKINQPSGLQSDSGISDDERRQTIFPVLKSFSNTSGKSFKTTEKNSILHSVNSSNTKAETNLTKLNVFDSSITDHSSNEDEKDINLTKLINDIHSDEESSNCTQHIHNLTNVNSPNRKVVTKSPNKLILIEKPTLRLSTKNSTKVKTPQKKDKEDLKHQLENDSVKKDSSITSSILSNSESSAISCRNNKYDKLPNSELDHTINFIKEIEKNKINDLSQSTVNLKNTYDSSSSDDEIYIKLRQNISKVEDTKHLNEKPINQTFHEIYSNDEEHDLPTEPIHDELKSPLTLSDSSITTVNCTNKLETDEYSINIVSKSKDTLNNEKKNEQVKKETEFLISPKYNKDKNKLLSNSVIKESHTNEMIKQILKEDSSIDNAVKCIPLMNDIPDKYQQISNKTPTSSTLKKKINTRKNQVISNPFLKLYSANSTSSSSDDEELLNKLKKSKEIKPSFKKENISLKKQKNKKENLIKKLLSSEKHKDKKRQQKLDVKSVDTNFSENDVIKTKDLNKNKSGIEVKNRKSVSHKLTNLVEENKPKKSISQDNLKKIKTPINDSTDDEIDILTKIVNQRKLNKHRETDVPNLTVNDEKLFTFNEILEILNSKSKSQNTTNKILIDKLIRESEKTKKERPKDSKDLILDSIDDSQNSFIKKKKKKTNQHSMVGTNVVSIDNNSSKNVSKNKNYKDLLLDSKINYPIEDPQYSRTKKKKKNNNLHSMVDTNVVSIDNNSSKNVSKNKNSKDLLLDSIINYPIEDPQYSRTKKKKKNNGLHLIDTKSDNMLKSKNSKSLFLDSIINSIEGPQSSHNKKKKKNKDQNSMLETNVTSIDTNSRKNVSKNKNSKDLLLDSIINAIEDPQSSSTKKKKKINDSNSLVETNFVSIDTKSREDLLKNKSSKDLLLSSIINSIEDPQSSYIKKKKKQKYQNSMDVTNSSTDINSDKCLSKKKKTKHMKVDLNNLTLKYNPKEVNSFVISKQPERETNASSMDTLKKKVKRLEIDPIRCDTQNTIINKFSKTDESKSLEKKGSSKKKKKNLTNDELKQFLSSQNVNMINNLNDLYRSLKSC